MLELNRYRRDRDILRHPQHKEDALAVATADNPPTSAPADLATDGKPTADVKPIEAKPADGAAAPAAPAEGGAKSPSADAPEKPATPAAPDKPAAEGDSSPGSVKAVASVDKALDAAKPASFVDRQLQKAIDYLSQAMATAK
jgi:hypothetical protein